MRMRKIAGSEPCTSAAQSTCGEMPNFSISAKAYAKIVLHCCKYPHRAVNGVVIGTFSDKDQGAAVLIQDAVPLFHQNLSLAPMLEVALRQVKVHFQPKCVYSIQLYSRHSLLQRD